MKQRLRVVLFLLFFLFLIFIRGIPIVSAGNLFVGGADLSPAYIGQDGTPFALHYSITTGLERNTEYYIKTRIKSANSYGYTWNGSKWLSQIESWEDFPVILMDDSGKVSGLIFSKNSSAPAGKYNLQIIVRKVGSSTNIESSINPTVTVLDMENNGGWLSGQIKDSSNFYENALILLKDQSNNVVGSYISEDNGIDDGYSSEKAGFVRLAAASGSNYKIEAYDINDVINPIWASLDFYSIESGKITEIYPNQPPVAEAGPDQNATLGQAVNFNASGSYDSDGQIVSYSWDFDGDGEEDSNLINPQYTYDKIGKYTATLTVTDDNGVTSSDQAIINVSWPVYSSNVILNELLPNPKDNETTDEYIEIFNRGLSPIDLSGWKLTDASGSHYIISKKDFANTVIPANGYFVLYREMTGIALNNSGGEGVYLYSPDGNQKDSVSYSGSAQEDCSYNRTDNGWQWSATLTPGAGNIITAAESDSSNKVSSIKKAKTTKSSSTKASGTGSGSVLGIKKAQAAGNPSSHHFSDNVMPDSLSSSGRWSILVWLIMITSFLSLVIFRFILWRKDRYKNDTIYQ